MALKRLGQEWVKTYGDQKEIVAEAQARLAAIGGTPGPGGVVLARQVLTGTGNYEGTVSGDGRLLAFTNWNTCRLAVKDLTTGVERQMETGDCETGAVPGSAISSDGSQIAYGYCLWVDKQRKCELRTIGVDGSSPRTVALLPETGWPIAYGWTPDYKEILVGWDVAGNSSREMGRQIAMVDSKSGTIRKIAELPRRIGQGRGQLALSPDGKWIAYPGWVEDAKPHRDVFVVSSQGGSPQLAVGGPYDDYPLGFSPDGKSLFAASNRSPDRIALRVELENGRPVGNPQVAYTALPADVALGFTRSGALLLTGSKIVRTAHEADLDPDSGKLLGPPRMLRYQYPMPNTPLFYLPDGKRAVYSSRSGTAEIGKVGIRDLQTGRDTTVEGPFELSVMESFSPDSRFVVATGRRQAAGGVREDGYFLVDLETGAAKVLIDGTKRKPTPLLPHIARDGKHAYFMEIFQGGYSHKRINLETLKEEPVWEETTNYGLLSGGVPFAPDGKRVAVRRGGYELHVMGIDGTGDVHLYGDKAKKDGVVSNFHWTGDGKWIYFLLHGSKERKSRIMRIKSEGGEAQVVFEGDIMYPSFSMHPSGNRISFIEGRGSQEIWALENLAHQPVK